MKLTEVNKRPARDRHTGWDR